jgi:hypothetical protein
MDEILPKPVYALLSGLNSATVGIIALAAVQLAEKAIKDKLTRILVLMGALAGLCYNALWYFPTLMAIGGLIAVVWDGWMYQKIRKIRAQLTRRRSAHERSCDEGGPDESIVLDDIVNAGPSALQRRPNSTQAYTPGEEGGDRAQRSEENDTLQPVDESDHIVRIRVGLGLVIFFFGKLLKSSK